MNSHGKAKRDNDSHYDVAIVGYGPSGVSAANFLGQYGVKTVVIEREPDVYFRARAVTVNDWTLRAYQSVGLDEALKADMEANGALSWRTYAGREVFQVTPKPSGFGHPGSMMIYQPAMEATLRRGVERFPNVTVCIGEQVTGIEQDDEGVSVAVTATASGEQRTIRATYVLACDGGSSGVREALGVQLEGDTLETNWIVIDAEVKRWWPNCKDLVFWSDPDRPVVDIPLSLGNHRWEFPLRPNEKKEDFDSEEAIWDLLRPMGRTPDQLRLKGHAFYVHHLRHAPTWRMGRVLLLGDAAHLMPPWAGQGMQSGIRDAQNVAWKLREVVAGRLDDSVLDTYQAEREPNVAAITEESRKLGLLIASRDPKFIRLRNTVGPILKHIRFVTEKLLATPPTLAGGWLRGTPGKRSAVGRMIPQPPMCTATGHHVRLDDVIGDGFAVLGVDIDPRAAMTPDEAADWDALGARFIAIRPSTGTAAGDDELVDHTGEFAAWMARYKTRVVAIRPDRFIAAADTAGLAVPTPVTASTTAHLGQPGSSSTSSHTPTPPQPAGVR